MNYKQISSTLFNATALHPNMVMGEQHVRSRVWSYSKQISDATWILLLLLLHTTNNNGRYYYNVTVSQFPSHTVTTGVDDFVMLPQPAHHVVGIKNGYLQYDSKSLAVVNGTPPAQLY